MTHRVVGFFKSLQKKKIQLIKIRYQFPASFFKVLDFKQGSTSLLHSLFCQHQVVLSVAILNRNIIPHYLFPFSLWQIWIFYDTELGMHSYLSVLIRFHY